MTINPLDVREAIDIRFVNISALIVKVTNKCNIDCEYCYENVARTGKDMPLNVYKNLVLKALSSSINPELTIIFHGGEPTTVSIEWYKEVVDYTKELAILFKKKVSFSIQSNFVGLSSSKLSILKELNIRLSASIDGPPEYAGAMRKKAEVAISNYRKAKEIGLHVGILLTINQHNFSHFDKIITWLNDDLKIKRFKANVVYSVGNGSHLSDMRAEQVYLAQKSIIDSIIATKGEKAIEQNIWEELNSFFNSDNGADRSNSLCHTKSCGAGKRVLGVNINGDLLPCGRFDWNDSSHFLGNISEQKFSDVFYTKTSSFHEQIPENWYDCTTCSVKRICSFSCQAFIIRSKSKANVECLPTKMRYKYYMERKEELAMVFENIKQRFPSFEYDQYSDSYSDYSDSY